ncbi:hypothetical protein [Microbacterium excoecariae]|uniref:hypothetical protein n=1 Tax=Microbacterium excoecariae TaxID=2715210 RepID=UPI00140B13F9|nr:hypothetical protein [Microbacterium excoecariae]NHI15845.1 hypothetical protein [Microbacterium excoecariae]
MAEQPLEDWLERRALPRPGLFSDGYDRDHVDQRLDEVIARLRAGRALTALVDRPDFPAAPRARAYDRRAVDDLFDNLKWGSDPRD